MRSLSAGLANPSVFPYSHAKKQRRFGGYPKFKRLSKEYGQICGVGINEVSPSAKIRSTAAAAMEWTLQDYTSSYN